MTRGFVTIATGHERYYKMARNLLRSYRLSTKEPMRFAIIADRRNKYTEEFDDVVILENPTHSWTDKMTLLTDSPYDENLFIDADCLVYEDINFFWERFENSTDFSCFGVSWGLEEENHNAWYTKQAAEYYPIKKLVHLHGMTYFIRKGQTCQELREICDQIFADYGKVTFRSFNGKPADEPVYALAMGIAGMEPVLREPRYYCFVPYATKIKTEYFKRKVHFSNPVDTDIRSCCIVHWGNINTQKAQYKNEVLKINYLYGKKNFLKDIYAALILRTNLAYLALKITDGIAFAGKKIGYYAGRLFCKLGLKKENKK